ncbi:MAG: hypothetical protein KGK16_17980 [Bradyrhizobium sp.]|uniref:hypothetical protein n=1 Tax=Bradyrhizobium sp. TaxID=376 RepID=UPI001EB7FE73|nr:hypothetical protein [Bradyrhizobium sp.]MBU6458557.1 hypothetical protein [Bradyrhizobium sp.]MDE2332653.1 hypothetical protein [Bradyrhizobium sp.]MDE2603226.1 hypothetical protein [Bradyrhizobium sp.]
MAQSCSTQQHASANASRGRVAQVIVMGGGGLGVAALLGALLLWLHYGTAVFFETIAAGISACF